MGKNLKKYLIITLFSLNIFAVKKKEVVMEKEKSEITKKEIIIPKTLKKGDTIGIVAPANFSNENSIYEIEYLKEKGFELVFGKSFYDKWYGFGGDDEIRANDINEMFSNKDIDGIFAIRGGYGSIRFVDKLDYNLIKENPKTFLGFSDITTLLIAINEKTGLVTFHGPMSSNFKEIPVVTEEAFNKAVLEENSYNLLSFDNSYEIMKEGIGEGQITGGNLSLVVATLGTPYEINTDGKILFLEEISEESYRVDRMLQQMRLAGKFDKIKGLILGDFKPSKKIDPLDMSYEEVFKNNFESLEVPIIKNLKAGHVRPFITIPIGLNAKIDTYKQEIIVKK